VLTLIQRQIGYLTRIIDDLLDVSRIAHGKLRLSREVLDLCELVHHSLNDQGQVATQSRVSLEAHVPPAPIHVKGDRTRLAQVLGNLIGNAVKFTDQGGRVTVSVRTNSDGAATIAIRDTGMGIEPAVLDKLFQPFSQGRPPQSRSNGGLGLGLALSKALIELHEGTIEARSEGLGRGSVFIVTLPVSDDVPVPRTLATGGVHHGARRILLIEDNDDAAEALQGALRLQGHEVDVACNGLEGIEKAYSLRPDLVLCDLAIPGIDGYEVARRLRADPRLAATPLVALSGYATTEDQRRSKAAGFDEHLAKPVAMDRLLDVIARAATHPQASRGVTA
jgi:two-component system, chemotaxis family, CheB/CheR fusion protein